MALEKSHTYIKKVEGILTDLSFSPENVNLCPPYRPQPLENVFLMAQEGNNADIDMSVEEDQDQKFKTLSKHFAFDEIYVFELKAHAENMMTQRFDRPKGNLDCARKEASEGAPQASKIIVNARAIYQKDFLSYAESVYCQDSDEEEESTRRSF